MAALSGLIPLMRPYFKVAMSFRAGSNFIALKLSQWPLLTRRPTKTDIILVDFFALASHE